MNPVVSRRALEAFIDERFEDMRLRPGMYGGTPMGVEAQCWLLIDLFQRVCLEGYDPRCDRTNFQAYRHRVLPRCPSPMICSQWFTDQEYGDPEAKNRLDLDHWAGVKIVELYIGYKAYLVANHSPKSET